MADVFLSYCRRNTQVMQRLKKDLQNKNISIWTDEGLTPGTPDWKKAVAKEVKGAKCFVVLMSPEANESEWVGIETGYAKIHEVPIIPVLISGNEKKSIPFELVNVQRIDIRSNYTEKISEIFSSIITYTGVETVLASKEKGETVTQKAPSKTGSQYSDVEKALGMFWEARESKSIPSHRSTQFIPLFAKVSNLTVGLITVYWNFDFSTVKWNRLADSKIIGLHASISYASYVKKEKSIQFRLKPEKEEMDFYRNVLKIREDKFIKRNWTYNPKNANIYQRWNAPLSFPDIASELIEANRILGLNINNMIVEFNDSNPGKPDGQK